MPEETKKQKVRYEEISREEVIEITTEGRKIVGYRVAFSTETIPYEVIFIPKEEFTEAKLKEKIAEKIRSFKPPVRRVGEVEI